MPTAPAVSLREVARRIAAVAGVPDRGLLVLPRAAVRIGGLAVPFLRELPEVRYQFAAPFVLDSTAAQHTFGLEPTDLDAGLAQTVAWWREQQQVAARRRNERPWQRTALATNGTVVHKEWTRVPFVAIGRSRCERRTGCA